MVDFPATALWRKAREGIVDRHGLADAHLPKEQGMDCGVNGTDPELYKSIGGKVVFAKKAITQIAGGINISRIIHVAVGIDI